MRADNTYCFYARCSKRQILRKQFPELSYQGSTGLLGFGMAFFRRKYRFTGLLFAILLFCGLQQYSWGMDIQGSRPVITQQLLNALPRYGLDQARLLKNADELLVIQEQIKTDFNDQIDWLNLYLDGHIYTLTYTPKIVSEVKEPSYCQWIASDDAIVEKITVSKGKVLVKANQYVKKGEVLISNEITDTNGQTKLVETDGKIYGAVLKTYEASVADDDLADHFSMLYFKIMQQVETEIGEDGHIMQENVLHYCLKEGKISLQIQFTLYKNIAQKETFNA